MKPIEATRQGVPGHGHTSAVRHGKPADKASPAGAGLDFGRGSSRGVSGPGAAAGAYKWVGSMGSRRGDPRPVRKHAYGVRPHNMGRHR